MIKDKHVIEAIGRAKVTIENGKVTKVEQPEIDYCPIFNKYHKMEKITPEAIKKNIQYRIDDFGMCTPQRKVRLDDMLSVGISEILKTNKELGNIDVVVGACDGVGTLLMDDPEIIQGVGGRVSALVSTTPIPEVIENVGIENVLDPKTASLDPIAGLKMALDKGYKKIAITILPSPLIKQIREMNLPDDVTIYILVAHTTSATEDEIKDVFEYADIVSGCASEYVRKYAQKNKAYYYGDKVSMYATSEAGHKLLDNRLRKTGKDLSINVYPQNDEDIPNPLL
ncbi:methanogenesis marker 8 protein [Methanosphaera cuniculi]|uniref:methanogenesis marker 8 protein n=1 Tax=Methanosphaera cuniculi TaxID=1077256 RepID=UPI0026EF20FD|nr:methanogenesis marker 8 protein [Methanosphaera cuniculi]